jgi:hypothetical protein
MYFQYVIRIVGAAVVRDPGGVLLFRRYCRAKVISSAPITSDLVVADAIRLDQVALDGSAIYWTESQLQKQGRSFVYP